MTAKPFYVSASQWKTADLCMRKWVFERIRKLPVYKAGYFGFGSVLHKCAERYLGGSEDLFPAGWDIDEETGVRLDPNDAQLVVVLIRRGIDEGILERRPGGEVEKKFEIPVLPGVVATGFIDHRDIAQVEDHKSSKSSRYLLSPKKLLDCIQMNTYGKERLEAAKQRGTPPPQVITYRHNQFVKGNLDKYLPDDPRAEHPTVRKTEAETTPHKIETFWREKIIPLTERMLAAMNVESPFDIEDPPKSACQAYGGCHFASLCSGGESIESYTKRISFMLEQQKQSTKAVETVSVSDFLNKRKGLREASVTTATPQINPPKAPAPAVETPAAVEDDGDQVPPPWFSKDCKVCATKTVNKGFNRETGKHCRMCTTLSKVSPEGYTYGVTETGLMEWSDGTKKPAPKVETAPARKTYTLDALFEMIEKAPTAEELEKVALEMEFASVGDRQALLPVLSDRRLELQQAAEPEVVPEPEPTPEPEAPKQEEVAPRRRGRPKKEKTAEPEASADAKVITSLPEEGAGGPTVGLIVVVGCAMNKPWPGRDTVSAEELLANTEGYYQNRDVFARRDALRSKILDNAAAWSLSLANTVVTTAAPDPDVSALVSSLAMLPNTVVIHAAR